MPAPGDLCVAVTVEQLWQPVPGGSGTYIVELLRELAPIVGGVIGAVVHRFIAGGDTAGTAEIS